MEKLYGVQSTVPTNTQLKNRRNLYSWFKRHKGTPAFWARALTNSAPILKNELAFLSKNSCKILLVFQDLSQRSVMSTSAEKDVFHAVNMARNLGVNEKNIAIFAEIKPEWQVNPRWMASYADEMIYRGYIPGFICSEEVYDALNTVHISDELSRWVKPVTDCSRVVFMLLEPKSKKDAKPHSSSVALQICGKVKFEGFETKTIEITDERVLNNLWLPQIS